MLSESALEKLLEKILASEEFCNSSIYGNYLRYLVKASSEGQSLKETTIAIDFFEKDADFNPAEDTIVRSHTYKLRKKLERYYFTEGRDDAYQIIIPKGHYQVSIVQATEKRYTPLFLLRWLIAHKAYLVASLFVITTLILFFYSLFLSKQLSKYHIVHVDDAIWSDYLQSELPILIIPGDHFMFYLPVEKFGRTFSVRDVTINSQSDLEAFKKMYNESELQATDEPYFPYHSIWSLQPVFSILFSANQSPIMRKSSAINPQMLNEYNIIFLGSIKTLYALKHTISKSHFDYEIAPHRIIYTPPDSGITREYTTALHSTGPNEDLVLVLKLPGPASNSIFIIASYHSLGAPEIANLLTDNKGRMDLINLFKQKYGEMPQYFEILFRVVGIDKTAYNREVLIYNELTR
ncbi:MAG: hypothetical protein JXR46_15060 [Calditrichaceae bacterium]|nr:hypothetical protein [Calditrichaceae bacterium]MBN2710361.1 hypothetical protein [Calditrichaceae bacterium]RQV95110.1 MAG: hypothetical protein EH224_08470 [Calditrichota bacterium]